MTLGFEDRQSVIIEGDAPIGVSFRVLFEEPSGYLDYGSLDGKSSNFDIDVAPSQGTKLTTSSPCGCCDMEIIREFRISIIGGAQQLTDLIDVRW